MNRTLCLYFAFFYLFFSHYSVAQRLIYDEKIPVEKLRVVLEQTRGGKISELLTDLEYIPLQGGKGNLIDYILDVQLLGDKIGVLSNTGGYFYLYTLDGSLVKKIDKIDGFKSPNPNTKQLFHILTKDSNHFLLNNGAFQAKVDLQGNIVDTLTRKFDAQREDGQYVQNEMNLGNSTYKFFGTYLQEKRKKYDVLSMNDSVFIRFDPIDTLEVMYAWGNFSDLYGDKLFLSVGYNTKIFELDAKGINKIYELVLPLRNTFDYKFLTKLKRDDWTKANAFFGERKDQVYGIDNLLYYKGYLVFRAQRWHNPVWIAYHLETKQVLSLNNIVSDASNDYLDFFDINRVFVEGEYLYSMIYPSHILQAKNKSQEEGHKMRKSYEDLAKSNNPILVRFKLK